MSYDKRHYDSVESWRSNESINIQYDRISFTYAMMSSDVKSILDVGCGTGLFFDYILDRKDVKFERLLGSDTSMGRLKYVKADRVNADITCLPVDGLSFDLVSAMEVFEHLSIDELAQGINELTRISKKYILISVPNNEHLEDNFVFCRSCKTRFHPSHHKRSFKSNEIMNLFNEYGFKIKKLSVFGEKADLWLLSPLYRWLRRTFPPIHATESPCPVCGFFLKQTLEFPTRTKRRAPGYLTAIAGSLRSFWPTKYMDRWIIVIYERTG
jgi:SAM-dependent methyltransferase